MFVAESTMSCPKCQSLNREHDQLCREEAKLTLAERNGLQEAEGGPLREKVLQARKGQARVLAERREHKAMAHSA